MPMSIARRAGEHQNHHVRPEPADVVHDVAKNLVAIPFLKGLVGSFGKAKIDGAREILFGAVDSSGTEELLAADDSQLVALLGTDQVLAAFAAGERQIGCPHVP